MTVLDFLGGMLGFGIGSDGQEVVVETDKGKVKGTRKSSTGIYVFRGVPYAAAPVGPRRFKKSVPHEGWEGVKNCTRFGKACVQGVNVVLLAFFPKWLTSVVYGAMWLTGNDPLGNTDPKKPQSLAKDVSEEECLNLNIETPSLTEKLPVMLWIHGGGFQMGCNSQFVYNPSHSPIPRKGVVLVNINYRLGLFGFLKVEGGDYNCGIYDQIAALEWVQRNITRFGGDPSNVTIFGESAGGMSCGVLSASSPTALPARGPMQRRLFHRVVLQSGGCQVGLTKEDLEWLERETARVLGVDECSVQSLAKFTAAQLLAAQNAVIRGKRCGHMPFQPVIDGELLQQPVIQMWRQGVAADLDFMIGYCKDEDLLFLKLFPSLYTCHNESDLLNKVRVLLGPKQMGVENYEDAARTVVDEVKDWDASTGSAGSPTPETAEHYWSFKAVSVNTILKFGIPAHCSAEALIESAKSVYMFRFDVHSVILGGAGHALDLPYVWGCPHYWGRMVPADTQGNVDLAKATVKAWTNFAATGNPNTRPPPRGDNGGATSNAGTAAKPPSPVLPEWPALTKDDVSRIMILDVPLAKSRAQHVYLHRAFPTLWKICQDNVKALWFHRPGPQEQGIAQTPYSKSATLARANL